MSGPRSRRQAPESPPIFRRKRGSVGCKPATCSERAKATQPKTKPVPERAPRIFHVIFGSIRNPTLILHSSEDAQVFTRRLPHDPIICADRAAFASKFQGMRQRPHGRHACEDRVSSVTNSIEFRIVFLFSRGGLRGGWALWLVRHFNRAIPGGVPLRGPPLTKKAGD